MGAVRQEDLALFRVSFAELAKVKRGAPVQVDPFLIARAVALVMHECKVKSASGRPLLWNHYRVVLARRDFELVRSLQGPLERDLQQVLAGEARARKAELVGELRITVVYDEADELRAGEGTVRVAFVATEQLPAPRAGEMTVRFDAWAVAGEIAARAPAQAPADATVFVHDATADGAVLRWPGGEAALAAGRPAVIGRPHDGAPAGFVALTGATPRINKQQAWIAITGTTARVGRYAAANPVHVGGALVAAGAEVEATLPVEISLSRGELVLSLRRT